MEQGYDNHCVVTFMEDQHVCELEDELEGIQATNDVGATIREFERGALLNSFAHSQYGIYVNHQANKHER